VAAYGDPDAFKKAFAGVEKVLLISSLEVGQRFRLHQDAVEATRQYGTQRQGDISWQTI